MIAHRHCKGPDHLHTVDKNLYHVGGQNITTAIAFGSTGSEHFDLSTGCGFVEHKTATVNVQNNTGSATQEKLITAADTDSDSLRCTVVALDKLVVPKSELPAITAALAKTES